MKVWASATAIGFSMAYLACSSSPASDNNTYVPPSGTAGASAAGASSTAGSPSGAAGAPPAGGGASEGGAPPAGGGAPPAGGAGGAPPAGGAGGGAPPAGGAGGGTPGAETEVACPANVLGHCSSGVTYPPYTGYDLALVEDFPTAIDLNADPIFTWSDGAPADGQTGFREQNITFVGGKMIITAESTCPAASGAQCYLPRPMVYGEALAPNATASVGSMGVWSGELRSKYNNYRYGRYEAKFKAPIANPGQENTDSMSGNYLSTMFIFRFPKNTLWNEIDVELEPWRHNIVSGNVLNIAGRSTYPGTANADEWSASGGATYQVNQQHVYAFNWTSTSVEWFVDGVSIQKFTGKENVPVPTASAKIMMNLWVFGNSTAFGDPAQNKFPFHAEYDYFHFYKQTGETYPCAPTPGCLNKTNGDYTASAQNNLKETPYLK